jgi:predicted phosphodiesterase
VVEFNGGEIISWGGLILFDAQENAIDSYSQNALPRKFTIVNDGVSYLRFCMKKSAIGSYCKINGTLVYQYTKKVYDYYDTLPQSAISLVKDNSFTGAYNDADIAEKAREFGALINNTEEVETLALFSDPHLVYSNSEFSEVHQSTFKQYISTLQKYYNSTPVDSLICCGDWLQSGDSKESACFKLGYIDATMRKLFKGYIPVVGNHDDNYQGEGALSHSTIRNLNYRQEGNTYYAKDGNVTTFCVLDTGSDASPLMDNFRWEQISWLAETFIKAKKHIVICMHIYNRVGDADNWNRDITDFAKNIQALSSAFNRRESIILNGVSYDFSEEKGKVECIMTGHTHFDYIDDTDAIPVYCITNFQDGNQASFDLIVLDYSSKMLSSVRIGTGNNRNMKL